MTTNRTSDLAGEQRGRHWECYMAVDPFIFNFFEAPETLSNEVFVNINSSGPDSLSSLDLITQRHSQQYGSTPRGSESLQDSLLLPVAGLGPLIPALMLRLQHAQPPTHFSALQGLLNNLNNIAQVLSMLSLGLPTSPTFTSHDTDPESGEPAESAGPPPYPNLTIFEWIMALIAHRRFEDTEDTEDSEECECGECRPQLERVPTVNERPCASPDHKYKAPPPYSLPPEVDRPEAHQFRPLSSQEWK